MFNTLKDQLIYLHLEIYLVQQAQVKIVKITLLLCCTCKLPCCSCLRVFKNNIQAL